MKASNWQLCTGFPGVSLKIPQLRPQLCPLEFKAKSKKKQSGFTHNTLSSTCMHLLFIVCVCDCKRSHMCLCTCVLRGKGRTYHRGEATEVLKWISVQPVNSNTQSVLTENRFLSPPSVLLLPHISDLCAS